jgi:hypothetical protein
VSATACSGRHSAASECRFSEPASHDLRCAPVRPSRFAPLAARGSSTTLSRLPARVSVKMRLATPRGRTTTTSNASTRPRASALRMVRRPARPRKASPRRSKTTRLGAGASQSRPSACSTAPTPPASKSPVSRKHKVLADSSTAKIKGLAADMAQLDSSVPLSAGPLPSGSSTNTSTARSGSMWFWLMKAITLRLSCGSTIAIRSSRIVSW